MGVLATSSNFITPEFRLSFPSVFEMNTFGGKGKYLITMLIPKETDLTVFKDHIKTAVEEAFGTDRSKWPQLAMPFNDGDTKDYEGYAGHVFVRASSGYAPGVVDSNLQPIINPNDIYGGMYCRAQINVYVWEFSGKHGVSFGLQNLQALRDGDPFGGRGNAPDVFNDGYSVPSGFSAGAAKVEVGASNGEVDIFNNAPVTEGDPPF